MVSDSEPCVFIYGPEATVVDTIIHCKCNISLWLCGTDWEFWLALGSLDMVFSLQPTKPDYLTSHMGSSSILQILLWFLWTAQFSVTWYPVFYFLVHYFQRVYFNHLHFPSRLKTNDKFVQPVSAHLGIRISSLIFSIWMFRKSQFDVPSWGYQLKSQWSGVQNLQIRTCFSYHRLILCMAFKVNKNRLSIVKLGKNLPNYP